MIKMEGSPAGTPLEALEQFRKQSPQWVLDQVKDFNKLGLSDRIELLFFMYSNQMVTISGIGATVQLMARGKKPD